jgi:putative phosphoribosyl transferase
MVADPGAAGGAVDPAAGLPPPRVEAVEVRADAVRLAGDLTIPPGAAGIVLFAHGSGSGRHSPRNQFVAGALNAAGLGTLLFDLLTPAEEVDRSNVFDIPLLAGRLAAVTAWLQAEPGLADLPVGYFGASTGGAAALWAAADAGGSVGAVVSRGGRPDLAMARLDDVRAPTLLIVGSLDTEVLELNRRALERIGAPSRLSVVQGASHLFEERGTLEQVAILARDWFLAWLGRGPASRP